MPMIKKGTAEEPVKKESGVDAAISRLQSQPEQQPDGAKMIAESKLPPKNMGTYKPRDFDAEARGKTRCVMYAAALQSMAIAGTKWKTLDDLKKTIRELADDGVKYSFQD